MIKNNKQYKGKITKIWAANLFKIKKNQKARIFIEGIDDVNILDSGAILHSENSITMHKKFNAKIYILTKDDGAWNNNNIKPSQTYTFSINESEYTGKTIYGEGEKVFYPAYSYHPGETDVISIELNESVFIYMNQSIALYDEDDDLVAHGNVVEILD